MALPRSIKKFINAPDSKAVLQYLKYGPVKRSGSILELRNSNYEKLDPPVFFLSTGRCGTKWFSELMKADKQVRIFHGQEPELLAQGPLAHRLNTENASAIESQLLGEIFLAAREDYLLKSYKHDFRLIETNNRMSFFAPQIAKILKNAKFVHLRRKPIDFILSGVNRGWYTGDAHDIARITSSDSELWQSYSQVEKIAFLWTETNQFIDQFRKSEPEGRVIEFDFDSKDQLSVEALCNSLGVKVSSERISKMMDKRINAQKIRKKTSLHGKELDAVSRICGTLCQSYSYNL